MSVRRPHVYSAEMLVKIVMIQCLMSLKKDKFISRKKSIRASIVLGGVIKFLRFLILISIMQALYNVKKFSWKKKTDKEVPN